MRSLGAAIPRLIFSNSGSKNDNILVKIFCIIDRGLFR